MVAVKISRRRPRADLSGEPEPWRTKIPPLRFRSPPARRIPKPPDRGEKFALRKIRHRRKRMTITAAEQTGHAAPGTGRQVPASAGGRFREARAAE
jgi:hypothetical protein